MTRHAAPQHTVHGAQGLVPLGEIELPGGDAVPVNGQRFGPAGAPVIILAGLHGDAAEGVAAAMALAARWAHQPPDRAVLLFSCLNPLAVLHGSHRWPGLDVDFASRLPGDAEGHAPDRIAAALFEHLGSAARLIELGPPDPGLWEAVHAEAWLDTVVPDVAVPWIRHTDRAMVGSPGAWGAIRLRSGRTGRVHPAGVAGLQNAVLELLEGRPSAHPAVQFEECKAESAGVFVPTASAGDAIGVGEAYGALDGKPCVATAAGKLIALRDKPTAYAGSTLARIAIAGSSL